MKLLQFVFFAGMAIPLCTAAQKNAKAATLTTTTGAVIQGTVDDREWNSNPAEIAFKANGSNVYKKYSATEAQSIKIENGDYYISKTVAIDKTPDRSLEVDNYLDSSYTSYKTATVFLLAEVVSDKMMLYSLNDSKLHLFAEPSGGTVKELIHREYRLRRNGKVYEEEDKTYLEQLKNLFADCPAVAMDIADTKYTAQAVAKEIQRYLNCGQATTSYRKKAIKGRLALAILAGPSLSGLSFTEKDGGGGGINLVYGETFDTKPSLAAGARFQYILPARQQKMSLVADLYYARYKGDKEKVINYTTPTFYTKRLVEVEFSMLTMDILFRYAFASSATVAPFVNTGVRFSKTFGTVTNSTTADVFGSNTTVTRANALGTARINPIVPAVSAGGGIAYKNCALEYRFAGVSRITSTTYYSSAFATHQLLLSWRLR